jgi:phosphonate degradation associated HDIG domain protein
MHDPVEWVLRLFGERGGSAYFGEAVSQTEHALQSAWLAEQQGADAALIASALLHDVGHLLHGLGEDVAGRGIDSRHEEVGAAWLLDRFGPTVAEPVRLHVPAKRYLCATNADYLAGLSPASVSSLRLQGGPFTSAEVVAFRALPHAERAVALRRWDDHAKVPGLRTPDLAHFRPVLEAARTG